MRLHMLLLLAPLALGACAVEANSDPASMQTCLARQTGGILDYVNMWGAEAYCHHEVPIAEAAEARQIAERQRLAIRSQQIANQQAEDARQEALAAHAAAVAKWGGEVGYQKHLLEARRNLNFQFGYNYCMAHMPDPTTQWQSDHHKSQCLGAGFWAASQTR